MARLARWKVYSDLAFGWFLIGELGPGHLCACDKMYHISSIGRGAAHVALHLRHQHGVGGTGGGGNSSTTESGNPTPGEQQMRWFPEWGVMNGTQETSFSPAADHQPRDTLWGWYLLRSIFRSHEEAQADAAAENEQAAESNGCPMLLNWPRAMEVWLPNPCGSGQGCWEDVGAGDNKDASGGNGDEAPSNGTDTAPGRILAFERSCPFLSWGCAPVTEYHMPITDSLFVSSQETTSVLGSSTDLRDCHGETQYTIEEQVSFVNSAVFQPACDSYGSCDGTVFVQTFLYDAEGRTVAQTPRLTLFQEIFTVQDEKGNSIATAARIGAAPRSDGCQAQGWHLSFDASISGHFAEPFTRWAIAAMVTTMARRDERRRNSGLVTPSVCEVLKLVQHIITIAMLFAVVRTLWRRIGFINLPWMRKEMSTFEDTFCPRRMKRPAMAKF